MKITLPGAYGRYPAILRNRLALRPARVLEYLDRLALSDELFADDQRVVGVVIEDRHARLVTGQPLVVGERPRSQEIRDYLHALDFAQAGAEPVFFRKADHVGIFDAHGGNFLRGATGQIFAIDVIPARLDAELFAAVRALVSR